MKLMVRPGDNVTQGQPLFVMRKRRTVRRRRFVAADCRGEQGEVALDIAQIRTHAPKTCSRAKAVPLKVTSEPGQS